MYLRWAFRAFETGPSVLGHASGGLFALLALLLSHSNLIWLFSGSPILESGAHGTLRILKVADTLIGIRRSFLDIITGGALGTARISFSGRHGVDD